MFAVSYREPREFGHKPYSSEELSVTYNKHARDKSQTLNNTIPILSNQKVDENRASILSECVLEMKIMIAMVQIGDYHPHITI